MSFETKKIRDANPTEVSSLATASESYKKEKGTGALLYIETTKKGEDGIAIIVNLQGTSEEISKAILQAFKSSPELEMAFKMAFLMQQMTAKN